MMRCVLQSLNSTEKKEMLQRFAEGLPLIRKRLGMSQSELGDKVGVSRQSISSIERGNVQLTWDMLLAILMVVMVNDNQLYNELVEDNHLENAINELKRRS